MCESQGSERNIPSHSDRRQRSCCATFTVTYLKNSADSKTTLCFLKASASLAQPPKCSLKCCNTCSRTGRNEKSVVKHQQHDVGSPAQSTVDRDFPLTTTFDIPRLHLAVLWLTV